MQVLYKTKKDILANDLVLLFPVNQVLDEKQTTKVHFDQKQEAESLRKYCP